MLFRESALVNDVQAGGGRTRLVSADDIIFIVSVMC